MIVRARRLAPVSGAPVENAAVRIEGNKIVEYGPWGRVERTGEIVDLGETILLPGLINAHCHLDYTSLRGAIAYRGVFTDWIQGINHHKKQLSDEDLAGGIAAGMRELLAGGCTAALNFEAFPVVLSRVPDSKLRVWWGAELIDLWRRDPAGVWLDSMLQPYQAKWREALGGALAPHAPFTASSDLYRETAAKTRRSPWVASTHVAESAEEWRMFKDREGPLFDWLMELGRDMSDCNGRTPLEMLAETGFLEASPILVHMNHWTSSDLALLRRHKGYLVHCPGAHRYFQRAPFHFVPLLEAGWNLCLGTDSLASNESLDLFREMRLFREGAPGVSCQAILEMVTIHPAAALRQAGRLGCIAPGALADLIAIPDPEPAREIHEAIVENTGPPVWRMINGEIV